MKEKRLATILYADLTGFTELSNKLGPERVTEFVNECFKTIDTIIYNQTGTVVRHEGDRVMAAFGFPRSKGYDSYSAILSALQIRDAVKKFSHPVQTHIGIATGEIVCDNNKLYGYVTETASQLEEKAPASEIYIDANCYELNKTFFECERLDHGVVPSFKLIKEKKHQIAYITTFFGREKEQTTLQHAIESGKRVIIVTGAQGIGKTRFVHHTLGKINRKNRYIFLQTSFLGTRTVQFYEPIINILQDLKPDFSIDADTELLSETAYNIKLFSQFCETIFNASTIKPLILLFQYFEQVDKSSLEFFKFLINNIGLQDITCIFEMHKLHGTILKVLTSVAKTEPEIIELEPLTAAEQHKMISDLCAHVDVPASIFATIIEHTGGNPLFLTEVCQLVRTQCALGKVPQRLTIPYRIKEVYNHLIDHIPVGIFDTLSVSAMYGYSVNKELLKSISTNHEETIAYGTENGLWNADNGELTFRNPFLRDEICNRIPKSARQDIHRKIASILREKSAGPETDKHLAYHFNECGDFELALHYALKWAKILKNMHANEHALEAFDHALAISRKIENKAEFRIIHERCEVLHLLGRREEEKQSIDRLEEIALQQKDDGLILEVVLSKGQYLTAISDFSAAVKLYENHVKKSDDIVLRERLGMAYYSSNLLQKAITTLNNTLQLARSKKDLRREAAIKSHLGLVLLKTGEKEKALELTRQALDHFHEVHDRVSIARCESNLALNHYYQSHYQEALKSYESALAVAREIGDVGFEAKMIINSASCYTIIGEYEKALHMYEQALETARFSMNRKWEAIVLNNIGNILATVGEHGQALRYFEEAFKINEEIGDRSGIAVRYGNIGDSYAHLGEPDKALTYIEKALRISEDLNIIDWISFYKNDLAQALLLNNRPDDALTEAQEAWKLARKGKNISYQINALSTIAQIYYTIGDHKQAFKHSKRAIDEYEKVNAIEGMICSIYFVHYKILEVMNRHDEAQHYLEKAYRDVKERGERIIDETMRRGFYKARKEHKEILAEWERSHNPK
ncbi:tetratricopeptide repeat protein [candidate division WOR-3 bacterium]|nr:tetratricopeptide repeat protein [candidate division WOR-3 bacterium]